MNSFKERLIAELDKLPVERMSSRAYHEASEHIYRNAVNERLERADWERKRRQEEGK